MLDPSSWDLESALRACLALALCVWVLWWALALVVAVVDPRTAARFGPPLLRALLVGGVLAATVAPAHAERSTSTGVLDGLPLPDRPSTRAPLHATPAPPALDRPSPTAHVVRPGDSLWTIAQRRAPHSSDAEIAIAVSRWHAVNRDVIGSDPDLIQPGQRLVPPGAP